MEMVGARATRRDRVPKTNRACMMLDAPGRIDAEQFEELHIRSVVKDD